MRIRNGIKAAEGPKETRRSSRSVIAVAAFAVVALLFGVGAIATASETKRDGLLPTIVLVHGDWADASSWNAVVQRLQNRGYVVVAPPNPLRGPTTDAGYLASFLQTISGPMVLVAHSYGGFVATNAATGNANVKALVYIDAFIPDQGQTLTELTATSCVSLDALNTVSGPGGVIDAYLRIPANASYRGFNHCFANGVDRKQAAVLAATQRPAAIDQFIQPSGPPAWAATPSWSLIGTQDRVIPQALQRTMSMTAGAQISTVDTGHLSLITRPDTVTRVIETAVSAIS